MNVQTALTLGERWLSDSSSPRLDAEVLLAHVRTCERATVLAHPEAQLTAVEALQFRWLTRRRAQGVPVAYLTHRKEFYGRTFYVNRNVLIPRPETELLVEEALGTLRANNPRVTVVDVGTGSGCIAVTLALELPDSKIIATDISATALSVARRNAEASGVAGKMTFLRGNLLEPALPHLSPTTLLVANLPYVLPQEITGGLRHEPRSALEGGNDGLKYYRTFVKQLAALPNSARPRHTMLELHPPSAKNVTALIMQALPQARIEIKLDTANAPRLAHVTLA